MWQPEQTSTRGSVLLLHGGGQTRHSWQRTGRRLAEHGWSAYAVDARGHGESQWADDGDYSIAAHARDVVDVAESLSEPTVLVGASLGGMASLIAQATNPGLARALVLVDITPRAEPEGLARIHSFMQRGLDGFDSLEDALHAVAAYNPHRSRPPRIEGLRKNLRQRDGRWYWHWDPRILTHRENSPEHATAREGHAREAARRIDVPTLLIRGAQSDVVSDAGVRELLELIPGSTHLDVSGAGHMVGGDDNDVLSEGLLDFLDTL
ncbi:alpha/beta hydrolase [Gordonia sp. L191]|uniref:alpha/beta fold hydrolase n=1 Tax=Gordonia sp. L191 TaxID=2982699 RepID=UPI0024C016A8|nr:alpha/beta hydrolase [Gordonia sp. L191]WHU50029.1 alpha/beta hydrolase [Gordonia sp. L191]